MGPDMQPVDPRSLADRLEIALSRPDDSDLRTLGDTSPATPRDRFQCLEQIYALHRGPLDHVGDRARWQHHPVVAALKQRCEYDWIAELDTDERQFPDARDAVTFLRRLAAHDRIPPVYRWLAREATPTEVVRFLALEGGPDAEFDDLVATCQVGLKGTAKAELARNYWDEMGNGDPTQVHTTLHDRLVTAIGLDQIALGALPVSALARKCLPGMLATNRVLQPELLGALGLTELQAGPRCRLVLQALGRCDMPADAHPFYRTHAEVDPRHGADWLANAVAPLIEARPDWASRIVRGARWRSSTNATFFDDLASLFAETKPDLTVPASTCSASEHKKAA